MDHTRLETTEVYGHISILKLKEIHTARTRPGCRGPKGLNGRKTTDRLNYQRLQPLSTRKKSDMLKPMSGPAPTMKEAAHQLIDRLPDDAIGFQAACHMGVRAPIERGLADSRVGRMVSTAAVRAEFGLGQD